MNFKITPPCRTEGYVYSGASWVKWFNPRLRGEYQEGSVTRIESAGNNVLGYPPSDPELDWVVVVQ